jgi:hypothetical protein
MNIRKTVARLERFAEAGEQAVTLFQANMLSDDGHSLLVLGR